jgi:hypothetical protein
MLAMGGGDYPEAVLDGLLAGAALDWRDNADKVMYLVGDAPAHGMGLPGDGFPDGCPCRATPGGVVEVVGSRGIRLNVISIAADVPGFKDFADACRGSYVMVEVGRMAESTAFTRSTLEATASMVGASRTYGAAVASLGTADPAAVAEVMGISSDAVGGIVNYLSTRGLRPETFLEKKPSEDGEAGS